LNQLRYWLLVLLALPGIALAAPTFQAAGAQSNGAGAISVAWPTHQIGDVALLIVETANQAVTTPAGWTVVANSPQGIGTAGGAVATRLSVFWARATSAAMPNAAVADSGDHQIAQILTFRGVIGSGNPWDVTAGNTLTPASTAFTIPGAVTTVSDTLVVAIVANATDSNAVQTSGWTNANLAGLAEIADAQRNSGNGGGFGAAAGVWAGTGNYGNTTGTLATSSVQGRISIALRTSTITLGNGTDPGNTSIAPGGAATMAGAFTFTTAVGADVVSAVVVGLAAGTAQGIALVEITNDAGSTVYGSVANPGTDTPAITLSTNLLNATTTTTQYKIRVTPRSHVNMPIPPGASYAVTAKINSWTSGYTPLGSDSAGTTVTIDNLSPGNASAAACTPGVEEVTLNWTNPIDADFSSMVVLQRFFAPVGDTPTEGVNYSVGNIIGNSTVACVTASSPCTDTGLIGASDYHYRLFAVDSNGNYSDTGIVPSGSPCIPAEPAAPRFNACDVGTTCTNATPPTQLYTKRAGVAFNLDLVALATNGNLQNYNNPVIVQLLDSSDNSALPDTNGCRSSWSTITTLSPNPGSVNGQTTVGPFTVANAYREVRVRVTNAGGASRIGCSTDNFSIRPTSFTVTSTDATQTGSSGTPVIAAGANFNLTAAAVAGYDATPLIDTAQVVGTPAAGTLAGSFNPAPIGTGTAVGNAFSYSEVGNFGLNTNAVYDSSFTSVDQPADCTADFSNTLVGGQYGCNFGSAAVPQNTGVSGFGRFIPDHFALTTQTLTPPCASNLTYMGQPFTLNVSVEARNAVDDVTLNYQGAYAPATVSIAAEDQALANQANDLGSRVGGLGSPSWVNGTYAIATAAAAFSRPAIPVATPLAPNGGGPFDTLVVGIKVSDSDSVLLTDPVPDLRATTTGICTAPGTLPATDCDAKQIGASLKMRYGRLRLNSAYGSNLLDLLVPVRAEHVSNFNGATPVFSLNTEDSCTVVPATAVAHGNATGVTLAASPILAGAILAAGRGSVRLQKPTSGVIGTVDLALNLTATANDSSCVSPPLPATIGSGLTWLQWPWCAGKTDPNARVKFGSSKAPYIYLHERY
jgi:hypothetical protein